LTIGRSGTGLLHRHPAQIPLSVFIVLAIACTTVAPNFDQPFINYAFASAIVFLFVAPLAIKEWLLTAIVALTLSLFHAFFRHGETLAAPSVSLYAGMLGRGGLVVLGWKTIWTNQDRPRLLRISLLPVGIVLFVLASLLALNLTAAGRPRVLDAYLYVFDGSLGFQPSFVLGQFLSRYRLLAEIARVVYLGLPVAIALVCAGFVGPDFAGHGFTKSGLADTRPPWRPLAILASAGALGYLLYWVFPATGPLYVSGASFPNSPHPFATLGELSLQPIALAGRAPRNAMPSLHMAWALLLWFNCRTFSRAARGFALAYVVLTFLATLGTGEHYFIDLVVALPFSIAVQALWTPVPTSRRYAAVAGGTILMLMWLASLRYRTDFFLISRAIPWACVVASSAISLWLERRLGPKLAR
jgi:hypothetical protein